MSSLHSGEIILWDSSNNAVLNKSKVSDLPVRCVRLIESKNWLVAGCDDMNLRVYNYATMDVVKVWVAHADYIRFVDIHPLHSLILSASDDMTIKLWDWEKDFECLQTFVGHSHYVMMAIFHPRDLTMFASASLDGSIKFWQINTQDMKSSCLDFTLNGHEKGVNCIDIFAGDDANKPFLISGSDDTTIKVWNYMTRLCLRTLEGHTHNITSVSFHRYLPLVASASEDSTVKLWDLNFVNITTLNHELKRAWTVQFSDSTSDISIAIGYDEGTIVMNINSVVLSNLGSIENS